MPTSPPRKSPSPGGEAAPLPAGVHGPSGASGLPQQARQARRRVALVLALAMGLPALALTWLGLQSIDADRTALAALRRDRLDQAARELALAVEDEVRGRAEGALAALRPELQAERARSIASAASRRHAGGRASLALAGLGGDVAVAATREPLVRGVAVVALDGRLLYPRSSRRHPEAPRADGGLTRLLEGRAAEAAGLKAAIARYEARSELGQALGEAAAREARGGREAAAARKSLLELALDPRDPEMAARARLGLARGLERGGDRAAAIAQLDITALVDPGLTTEAGLSVASVARLRAAELRLEEGDAVRALDGLHRLAADLADERLGVSAAEARLLESRLRAALAAVAAQARVPAGSASPEASAPASAGPPASGSVAAAGAAVAALARRLADLDAALSEREAEDAYARELGDVVVPDLAAAVRAAAPRPGEVAFLSVTPRRRRGGRLAAGAAGAGSAAGSATGGGAAEVAVERTEPRLLAYRLVEPAEEDGGGPATDPTALELAPEPLLVAIDLDLGAAVRLVVAPWVERIAADRGAAIQVHASDQRQLAAAGEPGGGVSAEPIARARFERLLPFWTIDVHLPAGDPEGGRARLRLGLQAGMVALLLAALLLGALWTLRALDRSLELAEMKAELVANVSHELRTPLTSIKLYTDLLRTGRARTDERRARCLDTIALETARLEALIDGLLAFTRHEQGREGYRFESLRPDEVALAALDELRPQLAAAGFAVEVAIEGEGALPKVRADRASLLAALKNLLQNAVKYSPPERRHVAVSVRARDGGAAIAVADKGVGIGRDELPMLFERFWRGESARQLARPGSGLGLALVKRVAEDHGGRVEVTSALGEGSTFTVWLPAAKG